MARLDGDKFVDDGAFESPTRAQYLNKEVSFEDYYRAIAKDAGISFDNCSDLPKFKAAIDRGDEHLNSIRLPYWDSWAIFSGDRLRAAFKKHGDFFSIAGGVCVAKQAARDAVDRLAVK